MAICKATCRKGSDAAASIGLAGLEDRLGLVSLIRLARFETSNALAKYAALQVLELPPPADEAAKAELVKNINAIIGKSNRQAAVWLRLYGRTLADPGSTLAEWDQARSRAGDSRREKSRTDQPRDCPRLIPLSGESPAQLDRDDEADAAMRRMFDLFDGTPLELQNGRLADHARGLGDGRRGHAKIRARPPGQRQAAVPPGWQLRQARRVR